jgi:predicted esterase
MKIRHLTLTLPARMKNTAHHDARTIAEAVGRALHDNGGQTGPITLQGYGQGASILATRAASALPKGGQHGG